MGMIYKEKSVFGGGKGLHDFLNPYNTLTPLVEIPEKLNPFWGDGIHIFLKLQYFLPLMNSKSITSYGILSNIKNKVSLPPPHTIVESSSGNTAVSLSVFARSLGIKNMVAYISDQVTLGKLELLKLFGINIVVNRESICPNPNDQTSGIVKAREMGTKEGIYNPGQYDNKENPNIHYKITGPQIYNQLDGNIQIFVAGLGTTGTFLGATKYLKEQNKYIFSLGVVRKPNNPIPGPRTKLLLKQIDFSWEDSVDHLENVGTKEAYQLSCSFLREGLFIGPSSGMAISGLFAYLKRLKEAKGLQKVLGDKKEINTVVVCPDSYGPYVKEYFKYLDSSYFPHIENESLLEEKNTFVGNIPEDIYLSAKDAFLYIYGVSFESKSCSSLLQSKKNIIVFDLRSKKEYEHFHLYDSQRIDSGETEFSYFTQYKNNYSLVFICEYGKKSSYFANGCRKLGIHAFAIRGGTIEWSSQKYPRFSTCAI